MTVICSKCGSEVDDEDIEDRIEYNVASIQSRTAWVRIELSDEQISMLARGMGRLVVVPTTGSGGER
jgi:hypothetical protein